MSATTHLSSKPRPTDALLEALVAVGVSILLFFLLGFLSLHIQLATGFWGWFLGVIGVVLLFIFASSLPKYFRVVGRSVAGIALVALFIYLRFAGIAAPFTSGYDLPNLIMSGANSLLVPALGATLMFPLARGLIARRRK